MLTPDQLADRLLRAPARTALFTDFDGTLSPIVADPATARPAPGAVEALTVLARRYRRVAVLSGRPLSFLEGWLPDPIDIGGLYGLEQRVAGHHAEHPDGARWRPVVAAAAAEAEQRLAHLAGVTVEPKGLSLTLHFRNEPAHAPAVLAFAHDAAARHGLHPRDAKASVELHPPVEIDKGTLLRSWATGAGVVAFFGDDLGDLAAFHAVRSLARDHGIEAHNVVVLGAETPPAVRAAADAELDGPHAVATLFQRLAAAS